MTWRKNPDDHQWEKGMESGATPTAAAPAAASSSTAAAAAAIATKPREEDGDNVVVVGNKGGGRGRGGETTNASTLAATSTSSFPNTWPNANFTNINSADDSVSLLTTSEMDHNDETHTLNSQGSNTSPTTTNNKAPPPVLDRLRNNVTEVLNDTLQILQGVPPPPRNNNNSSANGSDQFNNEIVGNNNIPENIGGGDKNGGDHNRKQQHVSMVVRANSVGSTTDDGDLLEPINFLQDDTKEMTKSRRIALALMKYKWYNPALGTAPVPPYESSTELMVHHPTTMLPASHHYDNSNNSNNNHHPSNIDPLGSSTRVIRPTEPPSVTATEYPSLAKAWAYFEHVTLPRYFIPTRDPTKRRKSVIVRAVRRVFCKANQQLDRAEPGESSAPTRLYDPLFTPLKQMGDFGLGIGLYFSTLRAMMILTLVAGLINIPNFIYFSGPHYSKDDQSQIAALLRGSAICPHANQIWVPCLDCNSTKNNIPDSRLANATISTIANDGSVQEQVLTFALRNFCFGATLQQGFVNYGTLIFFLVGILWLNWYLQKMEVKFDEDEQTAQDYSIVITNPPPDATDPEEWRQYLESSFDNCHVTVCTVAVDNDLLVRSLVERREKMKRIEMLVDPGTSLDVISLSNIAAKTERERQWYHHWLAALLPGIPELFGRVVVLTAKVQGLAQQEYPASNVFVSFETEAAQRQVLATLSAGALAIRRNDKRVVPDPKYLFRGEHVLQVQESEEPNTVRWQDLNAPWFDRFKEVFWTTVATIAAIALIAFIVQVVNNTSTVFAAFAIAIFNSLFPAFAKILTSLESHPAEGDKQTSLYFKIALFRWVNTAIVYTIIRPFTSTLDVTKGIIPSIYAQFFAEIVTSNVIQLGDPIGHLQRHFLAPRAKTQDAMNLSMQGQPFELAERYTNMTKLLFLAMWYCAIYPAALLMCSFALLVIFFVDRFSLFRTWKPAPHLGTSISKFSRNYFFSLAVVAMAVVSSYYWSAFPFDNLCQTSDGLSSLLVDNSNNNIQWNITLLKKVTNTNNYTTSDIPTLTDTTSVYRYCLQDLIRSHRPKVFPFTPMSQPKDNKWMTHPQETVTNVYGWTSIAVVGIVILSFFWRWWESIQGLFKSTYEPCGEDQGINFSNVPSMNTYIPQVSSPLFSYPLLATNITGLDTGLLEWTDPDREFEFYDLTKDAERLLRGTDISSKVVFSQVKHWPPPKRKKSRKSKKESGDVDVDGSSSMVVYAPTTMTTTTNKA